MASSLSQSHQQFIDHLKRQGRSTHTILAYGKDIAQLLAHLNQQSITEPQDLTTQAITSFQTSLEKTYTPKSISRKLNSIKTFCRFLKSQKFLTTNPATQLTSPTLKPTQPRILTKLEYRALRDAARQDLRLAAIIELLLQTGLRIGELGNLHLDDLSPDMSSLTIRPYESHPTRTVPLSPAARQTLNHYLKDRPRSANQTVFISPEKNLFITKSGHPFLVRNIRSAINRLFKATGINHATVNDLRHTFVAAQLAAGTPLHYVSQVVGHKRLSTTEHYLKYIKPIPLSSVNHPTDPDIKLAEL